MLIDYNILAVRSGDSEPDSRYPEPSYEKDQIVMEPDDGEVMAPMTATELVVSHCVPGRDWQRVMRVRKMKAQLHITEARVAVACSKYEKGGGWMPWSPGAIPVALTANAVSKIRTARRRAGKMLVGQVRYSQLHAVEYMAPGGLKQRGRLRLSTVDWVKGEVPRALMLDITLSGAVDVGFFAREIAASAASYRLSHEADKLTDADRKLLEALEDPEHLAPRPKEWASYELTDDPLVKS